MNELDEGAFDVFTNPPSDNPQAALRHRENVKHMYFVIRLIEELRKTPPQAPAPAPAQATAGSDSQEGDSDERVELQVAPLENVVLVPICETEREAIDVMRANAAEPEINNYVGVVAFAVYLVTRDDATPALAAALRSIVSRNQFNIGGEAPPPPAGGRGRGRGLVPNRSAVNPQRRELLRQSVEAMNGSADHDMERTCVFHHRRGLGVKVSCTLAAQRLEALRARIPRVYTIIVCNP